MHCFRNYIWLKYKINNYKHKQNITCCQSCEYKHIFPLRWLFSFISVFLITISLLNFVHYHHTMFLLSCIGELDWEKKIRWSTRTNGLLHLLIIWIFQWMYPVYYVHRRQNNFNRYPPYNISLRFLFFLPVKLVSLIETLCMAISHLVQELHCIINNCR